MISARLRRRHCRLPYLTGSFATRVEGWMPVAWRAPPEPICAVAAVPSGHGADWQVVQQRCRVGVVSDLPGGHEEAQGAAVRAADGMGLRLNAAFGASDQAAEIPFLTRRLDVVWGASR